MSSAVTTFIETKWPDIEATLEDYIRVPSQSPAFDPQWNTNGLLDQTVVLLTSWVKKQAVPGLTMEVIHHAGKTPLIFIEVAGTAPGTVLMYGHLDKQPPMSGWYEGLGPYTPVLRDGKLYGRGGADDGYAVFAAITALGALKAQDTPHSRAVIIIEACEESGSPDLPSYVLSLRSRIGTPSLIVCLDSGCGNYEQLWLTTSLRGMVAGVLKATILTEGVHSGASSGVVPSSFRITRSLLSRIEDESTGTMKVPELFCPIPPDRLKEASQTAAILGTSIYTSFPFVSGAGPADPKDLTQVLLRKTWLPTLSVTGADGFPTLDQAGNVLRTHTALKLSIRLPPRTPAGPAVDALVKTLEANPPYGAHVSFAVDKSAAGWDAPASLPWLTACVEDASKQAFGAPPAFHGEGGSIPFMGMLGELFPEAQFVVTGVLGPASNAHGPNEFLHVAFTKKIIAAVSIILAAHAKMEIGRA